MRFSSLAWFGLLLVAACGGNVVVDNGAAAGSGGAGGNGVGPATGTGNATSTGGPGPTSSSGPSSSTTGAGGGLPTCASFGYVAVGDDSPSCSTEGQECSMPGTCCGVPLVCKNGLWAMTPLTCQQACDQCGDGLGCSPNAVCIRDEIHDIQTAFRCAEDPCPPGETPDCTCAGALCTNVFLMCIGPGASTNTLVCTDGTK